MNSFSATPEPGDTNRPSRFKGDRGRQADLAGNTPLDESKGSTTRSMRKQEAAAITATSPSRIWTMR